MRRPSLIFLLTIIGLFYWQGILLQNFFNLLLAAIVAYEFAFLCRRFLLRPVKADKDFVFITGTSSGFGRIVSHYLAARGFIVIAGVRKEEDGHRLVAEAPSGVASRIKPFICDVTKPEQISAAVEFTAKQVNEAGPDAALVAVINNAGIMQINPLELQPDAKLRQQFDVNFFGAVDVTKAVLPQLRKTVASRGKGSARVLFLGSLSTKSIASFFGGYAASKVALEIYADALAAELKSQGILVSTIEPGVFPTTLVDRSRKESLKDLREWQASVDPEKKEIAALYASEFETVNAWYHDPAKTPLNWVAGEIDGVLRSWNLLCPKKRTVGFEAYMMAMLHWWLPEEIHEAFTRSTMKPGFSFQPLVDLVVKHNPPFDPYTAAKDKKQ